MTYQIVCGHVFGKQAAVINFYYVQSFTQAISRHCAQVMVSFYSDDADEDDLQAAESEGQKAVATIFDLMGMLLSDEKRTTSADFLGLIHTMPEYMARDTIKFVPHQALRDKLGGMT